MRHHDKRHILRRISIIEGQIRSVQRLVQQQAYCIDIFTQTAAIKRALSAVEDEVLRHHLHAHVVH